MLLSFPTDVSVDQVRDIAMDWCEHFFETGDYGDQWGYVLSVHDDRDHMHAHIILNNRGVDQGTWFSCWAEGVKSPQLMHEKQAEIAEGYGIKLEATTRLERGIFEKPTGIAEINRAKEEARLPREIVMTAEESAVAQAQVVDDRHLQGNLWYPARETEGLIRAHGNAVWEPISVIPDAEPVAGRCPLVILAHGMFGNARNQAWLASALTKKGYIVAAIDHPDTSTFQRDPDQRRELWERSRDITRTIDYIIDSSEFGNIVDQDRIFVAGHSLGGFTAVALAGGRFDPAKMDAFCAGNPGELVCGIFDDWNVAKTPEDREAISKDLSDARIAGFAVFDLGGTQAFATDSLGSIDRPVLVIGAPLDILGSGLNLDIESRALVAALPSENVRYIEPPTLSHFDFLGVCTQQALDILKDEEPEDVFVCEQGREQRRQEQQEIVKEVADFFAGL